MSTKNQNTTLPSGVNVAGFLERLNDERKAADSHAIVGMMREISGHEPVMWGASIIGFGTYHYKYATGREGDMPVFGFSPRKTSLVVYLVEGFTKHRDLLARLGNHTTSVSCLYFKRLSDIDESILKQLISDSYDTMMSGTLPYVTDAK